MIDLFKLYSNIAKHRISKGSRIINQQHSKKKHKWTLQNCSKPQIISFLTIEQLFKYGQRSAFERLPNNHTDSKILSLKRKNMSLSKSFKPICSMYGIFTNICPKNHPNVGKYTIHGAYGRTN